MPTPRTDESRKEFISRCVGDAEARKTFPKADQRAAFCHSQWRRSSRLSVNVNRYDPTQTTSIRRSYEAEMRRRFREIRKVIIEAVVLDDVFGLVDDAPAATIQVSARRPRRREFAFPRSDRKVQAFMDWLAAEEAKDILGVQLGTPLSSAASRSWQNKYIKAAYSKSLQKAAIRLKQQGVKVEDSWLEQAFFRPVHADRVGLIFTRTYTSLSGITKAMDTQLSRTLARGLVEGLGARKLARELVDRVDAIGITRARMLARTEVISAAAEATINSYKEAGVLGVETQAEFATAEDAQVCPKCEELQGKIYPIDETSGIIPVHPNCILPGQVVEGNIVAGSKSWYTGSTYQLKTKLGHRLSLTRYHPVLTQYGWISTCKLRKGMKLLSQKGNVGNPVSLRDIYDHRDPALIDEIVEALRLRGFRTFKPRGDYFHGDGDLMKGDVDIVGPNLRLLGHPDVCLTKQRGKLDLPLTDIHQAIKSGFGSSDLDFPTIPLSTSHFPSSLEFVSHQGWRFFDALPLQQFSFGPAANWYVPKLEPICNDLATQARFVTQLQKASAGQIVFDELVDDPIINYYDGHVYDLQTMTGWMVAQGIVISNCRCAWLPVVTDPEGKVLR